MENYELGAISKLLNSSESKDLLSQSNLFSEDYETKFNRQPSAESFAPRKVPDTDLDVSDKKKKNRKRNRKGEQTVQVGDVEKIAEHETEVHNHDNGDTNTLPPPQVEMEPQDIPQIDDKGVRTIFVGNVPLSVSLPKLNQIFSKYGEIQSSRMRSVPVEGTAVDEAGNQKLVRKVCANSKKFGDQKGSYNAYIVFKEANDVAKALEANNIQLEDRHIRVDKSNPSLFDPKRTVFIGGIHHYADEELLRKHFATALTNGQDDIESIRLVRDPETQLCKGFGYVLLKDRDTVIQALTLHESKFKNRVIRVTTCGKRTKRSQSQIRDKQTTDSSTRETQNDGNSAAGRPFKRAKGEISGAQRRVQMKAAKPGFDPKNFIGKKSKENKRHPAKKKQLGGAVKKAFKALNNKNKK